MTSVETSRANLARGQQIRLARAQLRRQVADGHIGVMAAMRRPEAASALVEHVLQWQHRVKAVRARDIMRRADIGAWATCGDLTDRQRANLSRALRGETVERWGRAA